MLVLALAVLAVGTAGLLLWHRRWWASFRAGWSDEAGWRKLRPAELRDGRSCPGCKSGVFGWRDQAHHETICGPYMAYVRHTDEAIRREGSVRAEVIGTVGGGGSGRGDGSVDTMLPGPDGED